jgi:anaerobic magnesium-protoporphyrin IX monomethyl ester cyclase
VNVFLTHSYFILEDEKEQQIVRPYPPLGLLYVSAFLKKNEVNTVVFDTTFEDYKTQQEQLLKELPDVVAIYTNLMTKINVLALIKWIRNTEQLQHTRIALGGPDLTYNVDNYLNNGAHFLVLGEGEETMLELVHAIDKKETSFENIPGIAYQVDGESVITKARIKLKDLGQIAWPDRASIPLEKYLAVWRDQHGKRTTNISTQRGCPYTCKWCSTAVYGQSYRRRPALDVVDEIWYLKNTHQVEALWFVDDVFTVSHKWLDELYEAFMDQGLVMPFEIITRAERLNDRVLQQLKEMGCFRIWIGAESGSQKIIDAMDRRVDIVHVQEMIIKTKSMGIEAGTFVMVGYPGETIQDIYATYRHLKISTPNEATVTKAYPIKGTGLYSQIENDIMVQPNWATSTDREIDFKRNYIPRVYDYAIRFIMNGYYAEQHKQNLVRYAKFKLKSVFACFLMHLHKGIRNEHTR